MEVRAIFSSNFIFFFSFSLAHHGCFHESVERRCSEKSLPGPNVVNRVL